jgi:hypothetical protein
MWQVILGNINDTVETTVVEMCCTSKSLMLSNHLLTRKASYHRDATHLDHFSMIISCMKFAVRAAT